MNRLSRISGFLLLAAALLLVLAVMLAPILKLAAYTVPAADDFRYGRATHQAWEESGRMGAVLKKGAETAADIYREWQGTYAAIFLMTLQPAIFGPEYYGVTAYLMIGSLLIGTFILVWTLGKYVLKCAYAIRLILFALLSIACVGFLPFPYEAFYWYNSGIYYVFFYALSLLLFSLMIAFYHRPRGRKTNALLAVPMLLLCAVIGSGNFATALILALLLLFFALLALLVKRDGTPVFWLAFAILTASLLVSVLAPGNAAHTTAAGGLAGAARAIVKALVYAVLYGIKWTTLPILLLGLIMLPAAWRTVKGMDFSFRLPWLPPVASLLLLGAGYTPTFYTIDFVGPDRLLDIQFFLYVTLLYANMFYLTGWLNKQVLRDIDESRVRLKRRAALGAALLTVALFVVVSVPESQGCLSTRATAIMRDGSAAAFRDEMDARFNQFLAPEADHVICRPLSVRPNPLYVMYDLSDDPDWVVNRWLADYFGLASIAAIDKPAP